MELVHFIDTSTEEIFIKIELRMYGNEIYYHLFSPVWATRSPVEDSESDEKKKLYWRIKRFPW